MKKFLLIAIVLLLSLSFVACSGTVQYVDMTPWKMGEYEKLTYRIYEEGVSGDDGSNTGVLVMEMEELNADGKYVIPQINATTKKQENKEGDLE